MQCSCLVIVTLSFTGTRPITLMLTVTTTTTLHGTPDGRRTCRRRISRQSPGDSTRHGAAHQNADMQRPRSLRGLQHRSSWMVSCRSHERPATDLHRTSERIDSARWLHPPGKSSRHPVEPAGNAPPRTSRWTSRNGTYERALSQLLLVASTGQRHRDSFTYLRWMSANAKETSNSITSSMGMAIATVAALAHQLHRTTRRQHVSHHGRRTKQIPENHSNEVHNFGQDHLKSLRRFRSAPHSGDHCHRQWSTVRIRRVRRVRQGKRHSPHPKCTVPSSDQRTHRALRPDIQASHEGHPWRLSTDRGPSCQIFDEDSSYAVRFVPHENLLLSL